MGGRAIILSYMQWLGGVVVQRQGFSLIDKKLPKLQPSENGRKLTFLLNHGVKVHHLV